MSLINNHFLAEDHGEAYNELECMTYCLSKSIAFIEAEDYEKATAYMDNVKRSMQELQRLNMKKQHNERIEQLANKLKKQNVNVVLLRRY